MAKGEHTEHHPLRKVGRGSYWDNLVKGTLVDPILAQAQAWMNNPSHAPSAPNSVASLSPETLAEFGLGEKDWADPHGMKRPDLTGVDVADDMVRRPDGGAEQPPHLDVLRREKD